MEKITHADIEMLVKKPLQEDINYYHITGRNRRSFVKIYADLIDSLNNITGIELKVLLWLSMRMDYNKASFIMDEEFWGGIEKDLSLSHEYARRIITSLKRKGFIYDNKFNLYISSRYASKKKV